MRLPIIRPNVDKYQQEILESLKHIVGSNMLTNVYKYTAEFEHAIGEYLNTDNTLAVSCGTSGLILALEALGVRNTEVIIPSYTFAATAAAVHWTNNNIKYADIDDTFTIDPNDITEKITDKTGAILAVHMYGNPCRIRELREIALDNDLKLIFDAAHALGSEYNGKKIGRFGHAEVFSLSPTKLITTGEGGLITTGDNELAERLRPMRNYGLEPDYESAAAGLNTRMSELHAAVGLAQVPDIDTFVSNRARYVATYKAGLKNITGIRFQDIPPENKSAHKDFSVIVDPVEYGMDRNELSDILGAEGIGTKYYFYPPMHRLEAYRAEVKLPKTDYTSDNILSLPIHNFMNEDDIRAVCKLIAGASA